MMTVYQRRTARILLFLAVLPMLDTGLNRPALAGAQEKLKPLDSAIGRKEAGDDRVWYDGRQLTIEGKAWEQTENFYERLPARAKDMVTPAVWELSKNTAGLCIRFATNASHISARWALTSSKL